MQTVRSGAGSLWTQAKHYKIVGETLAAARQRANVTQDQLAQRLNKPQSFVSAYEGGKRRVDLIEFLLIARTLGADPHDILSEIMASVPACTEQPEARPENPDRAE